MPNENNLSLVERRISLQLQNEEPSLMSFWNDGQNCFAENIPNRPRVNVTSTSFCVMTILQDEYLTSKYLTQESTRGSAVSLLEDVTRALLDADWQSHDDLEEYNPYTTPIAISALSALYQIDNTVLSVDASSAIANIQDMIKQSGKPKIGLERMLSEFRHPQGGIHFPPYGPSGFLTYWTVIALHFAIEHLNLNPTHSYRTALHQQIDWAEAEVHRLISERVKQDGSFDVIQLGFALSIYAMSYRLEMRDHRISQSLQAIREYVPSALQAIFDAQRPSGLWPRGEPVYQYGSGGAVHTFSYEMLGALLQVDKEHPGIFRPYLPQLEVALNWAEANFETRMFRRGRRIYELRGWRADHLTQAAQVFGPWARSTAAVFFALREMRNVIRSYVREDVLEEFEASRP